MLPFRKRRTRKEIRAPEQYLGLREGMLNVGNKGMLHGEGMLQTKVGTRGSFPRSDSPQ
jgi:hypothetical protein